MNMPKRAVPRVPAGPKSLAAAASRTTSPIALGNNVQIALAGVINADVAIDAIIAIGERLESRDHGCSAENVRTQASLLTRLGYVAHDQVNAAIVTLNDTQEDLYALGSASRGHISDAFAVWRDRKIEQMSTVRCSDDIGLKLDAAEIGAFNALASIPAATAEDVVLKLFALASIECDDGLVHEGATTIFDLQPPAGRGYLSTMWRALLGDMVRVSDDVRAAAATVTPNDTMQVAA